MKVLSTLSLLFSAVLLGCGGGDSLGPKTPSPKLAVAAITDQPSDTIFEADAAAHVIHVTATAKLDQVPAAGIVVTFVPLYQGQGGPAAGSVFAGSALTDANGVAKEVWTIPQSTDGQVRTYNLEVRAVDQTTGQPVVFATLVVTETVGTRPQAPGDSINLLGQMLDNSDPTVPNLIVTVGTNVRGGGFNYQLSGVDAVASVTVLSTGGGQATYRWNLGPSNLNTTATMTICVAQVPTLCLVIHPLS